MPHIPRNEYWRAYKLIRNDVEAAIKSNHTYIVINNLVATERPIYDAVNRFPDFWNLNRYALQTTFFISFGRVFDSSHDAFTIRRLIAATVAYPDLFSKAALRERKRQFNNLREDKPDPHWLPGYLAQAWEPSESELQPMQDALAPHLETFNKMYRPIRNKVVAHRSEEDEQAIAALFEQTLIGDVWKILRFLYTVLYAIQEMANNGRRPDLSDVHDYERFVSDTRSRTEQLVRSLSLPQAWRPAST